MCQNGNEMNINNTFICGNPILNEFFQKKFYDSIFVLAVDTCYAMHSLYPFTKKLHKV